MTLEGRRIAIALEVNQEQLCMGWRVRMDGGGGLERVAEFTVPQAAEPCELLTAAAELNALAPNIFDLDLCGQPLMVARLCTVMGPYRVSKTTRRPVPLCPPGGRYLYPPFYGVFQQVLARGEQEAKARPLNRSRSRAVAAPLIPRGCRWTQGDSAGKWKKSPHGGVGGGCRCGASGPGSLAAVCKRKRGCRLRRWRCALSSQRCAGGHKNVHSPIEKSDHF